MRRSTFDESRDQAVADHGGYARGYSPDMMCSAHGCPNRWSVDAGAGRLCSAHAWASTHDWPRITQAQIDAETQRAIDAQSPKEAHRYVTPDPAKLHRYLRKMSDAIRNAQRNPRAWADRLREREEAGEMLTIAQREAWRSVRGLDLRYEEAEA